MALTKITNSAIADDIGLGGNPTTSTQTAGNSTTRIATTAFVSTAVANLVGSAPETLNTLAELATSIGNSATLSSTLTSSIATKLPLAGGTLTGNLNLGDNVRARFGTDNDLQIYHDGSDTFIDDSTGTGNLYVLSNQFLVNNANGTQNMARFADGGAVTLYYSGGAKLATTNTGIDVTGNASFADSGKATFGASDDLEIYHSAGDGHSRIVESGSGRLYINASQINLHNANETENLIKAVADGAVTLYHNGLEKITTTSTGVDVTGNIGVTGTVDGIDIAARDAVLTSTTTTAGAALPKAGGTMTGDLLFGAGGEIQFGGSNQMGLFTSSGTSHIRINSGIFKLRADDMRFTAQNGTTEYMRIDSNGKVGIGTSSPGSFVESSRFVVGSGTSGTNEMMFLYSGTNTFGAIGFADGTSGTARYKGIIGYHHTGDEMFFSTNGGGEADRDVTITSAGNVGIGNVVSQAYVNEGTYTAKLRVGSDTSGVDNASAIQIVGKDSSGSGILGVIEFLNHRDNDVVAKIAVRRDLESGSYLGAGQLDFSTDDGNGNLGIRLSIDANGMVGMGTTTPGGKLHIKGSTATGDASHILFENTQGSKVFAIGGGSTGITNGNLYFRNVTDNTRPMVITDAGNVGIGIDTPSDGDMSLGIPKVHVYGGTGTGSYALLQRFQNGSDADDTGASIVLNHSNDRGIIIEGGRSTGNRSHGAIKSIDNIGRVTNAFKIFGGNGAGVNSISLFTGESTTTTERMTIDSSGNVGIGTTDPDEKLHVAGQASFEGAGNVNRGNIIIGAHGSGSAKWATLAATHYNDATGSASGTGGAGCMIIGNYSDASNNRIYIGGGPYELNPATEIRFNTHSSNLHNLGGSLRMLISSTGNVGIGVTSPDSYPAGNTTGSLSLPLEEIGMRLIFKAASGNGHAGISTIDQSGAGLMIGANTYVNSGGSVVYGRSDHPSSGIYFDGWSGDRMRFYTGASGNPTERMSILADGRVGIGGIPAESDTLTVATTGATGSLRLVNSNAGSGSTRLVIENSSASPAANDGIGEIQFIGKNSAGNANGAAYVSVIAEDVTNGSYDSSMNISTLVAGYIRNRIRFTPTQTVVNEDSQTLNFRVESNNNDNMIYVDGTNDRVGIGRIPATHALEVAGHADFKTNASVAGSLAAGATVITSADASNAFIVKTNHSGNPTALQIGGSGAINGVSSANQSFTILNVAKDSGSGNSAYFHGHVKTAGVYRTTHTSSVGHETSINILNNDPVDGGSDFDQDPTNNVDGGGTTWSISGSGDAIYFENTSGGHGGTWMKVNVEEGYYVIKGTVRLTNTDQTSIHPSTSSANYKYTHSFRFEVSGGPDTGHLKWDADAIASANGTAFTRAGFCSSPVYMAAGNKTIGYNTNGYNGVQQIYITNLELVRIG